MSDDEQNLPSAPANPFGKHSALPEPALVQAAIAREYAEVQAAALIAKRYPRDPIKCVDQILKACTRTSLAEMATYEYARGGTEITGASIRLAEELARGWGNLVSTVKELARSSDSSECLAYAWDLETNWRDDKYFTVPHYRESGGRRLRLTSDRDIYETIANMGARRKRACILAVIPGDVQEAALRQCQVTLTTKVQITNELLKDTLEKLGTYGVSRAMIEALIQRRLEAITPGLWLRLSRIYTSLQDGMSAPADWFDLSLGTAGEARASVPTKGVDGLAAAMENQTKGQAKAAAPPPMPPAPEGRQAEKPTGPAAPPPVTGAESLPGSLLGTAGVTTLAGGPGSASAPGTPPPISDQEIRELRRADWAAALDEVRSLSELELWSKRIPDDVMTDGVFLAAYRRCIERLSPTGARKRPPAGGGPSTPTAPIHTL